MKEIFLIFLINLLFYCNCKQENSYALPSEIIEKFNNYEIRDGYYQEVIDDLIEVVDRYVFLDILKDPPVIEGIPTSSS